MIHSLNVLSSSTEPVRGRCILFEEEVLRVASFPTDGRVVIFLRRWLSRVQDDIGPLRLCTGGREDSAHIDAISGRGRTAV